jgi:hypothetical protein
MLCVYVCVCVCVCVCVSVCVAGFLSGNGMPDGVPGRWYLCSRAARHALFPKQVRRTLLLVPFVLGH